MYSNMTGHKKKYTIIYPFPERNINILSTTPSGAAKKSYTKGIRPFINEEQKKQSHIIKLINESGKIFEYNVKEVEKNDFVCRGNKKIPYTYNVSVKSRNINKSKSKKKTNSKSKSKSKSKSYSHENHKKTLKWVFPKR